MPELLDALSRWLSLFLLLGNLLVFCALAWLGRHFARRAELAALSMRVTRLESSENELTRALGELPKAADMLALRLALEELRGNMAGLAARMEGDRLLMEQLRTLINHHNKHLMRTP